MLAVSLRRILVVQAVLTMLLLVWTIVGAISFATALVWIAILFLGLPLLAVLLGVAIATAYRSSRPRGLEIGAFAWLKLVVIEWIVHLRWYGWRQAFPERCVTDPDGPVAGRTPVLLVHGWLCNRAVWMEFSRWFAERGYAAYTVSMEPVLGSIDAMVDSLEQRLVAVRVAHGGQDIDLVCHSMGGLVVRTLIRRCGAKGIRSVVTLGTPHQGTAVAQLAIGQSGRELRRGSSWIKQLNQLQPTAPELPHGFTSIFTYDDNLVSPQESSRFAGAENIPISGLGHASLLSSRRVFDLVMQRLTDGCRA